MSGAGAHRRFPCAELGRRARNPENATLPKRAVDVVLLAEPADTPDRPRGASGEPRSFGLAEVMDEAVELVVPAGDPAAVAAAGSHPADVLLDDRDRRVRGVLDDLELRPEPGVASADDAHVDGEVTRECLREPVAIGECLFEPPDRRRRAIGQHLSSQLTL